MQGELCYGAGRLTSFVLTSTRRSLKDSSTCRRAREAAARASLSRSRSLLFWVCLLVFTGDLAGRVGGAANIPPTLAGEVDRAPTAFRRPPSRAERRPRARVLVPSRGGFAIQQTLPPSRARSLRSQAFPRTDAFHAARRRKNKRRIGNYPKSCVLETVACPAKRRT